MLNKSLCKVKISFILQRLLGLSVTFVIIMLAHEFLTTHYCIILGCLPVLAYVYKIIFIKYFNVITLKSNNTIILKIFKNPDGTFFVDS